MRHEDETRILALEKRVEMLESLFSMPSTMLDEVNDEYKIKPRKPQYPPTFEEY